MRRALVVVDVQRDFCEGGSLAVEGGAAAAARISEHLLRHDEYEVVVATRDWHLNPGRHFAPAGEEPDFSETWPVHCVADTEGAEWHPDLDLPDKTVVVSKGQHSAAYSGFEGRTDAGETLRSVLEAHGIEAVEVAGIATSYCVRATALDSLTYGWPTIVLVRLTADVDPLATPRTLEELASAGAAISR